MSYNFPFLGAVVNSILQIVAHTLSEMLSTPSSPACTSEPQKNQPIIPIHWYRSTLPFNRLYYGGCVCPWKSLPPLLNARINNNYMSYCIIKQQQQRYININNNNEFNAPSPHPLIHLDPTQKNCLSAWRSSWSVITSKSISSSYKLIFIVL